MQSNIFDKEKYPNVFDAYQYALDVIEGVLPNCIYIYGACKRFLEDFKESQNPDSKYFFDIDYVERYLRLVQKLEHVIGNWDTKEIIYQPWQKWVWANALGFKHREDVKRPKYRTIHLEVPRGSAKSTQASQCALYFLGLEPGRVGEKLAVFATKSDQSRIILDASRAMASKSENYRKATGVEVLAHKLVHPKSFSEMVAMSSDSKSMDGLNLRIAFCDELHAMNRELFEVIVSGMKKRKDSLTICCTTAGFNTDGVGYDQSLYAKKVAKAEVKDDSFFSAVYTIDEGDDIFDENVWKKANPNYGVSVDTIAFIATAEKAKVTPSDIANFKVKHLNCWISEANAYYDLSAWDKCKDISLKFEDFYGEKAYVGIDLASKIDLTSFAILFRKEGIYYFFDRTYIPEETVKTTRSVVYDNAIAKGELIATQGEAIHYPKLEQDFLALSKEINIISGLFDPWNAISFGQNMVKERIDMKEFRMTTANLSEATKTLDALIRQGRIKHNGSELIRWCLSNVVAKEDAAGNVFPKKSSDKLKIDPIVALIMALAAWMQEDQEDSVYETRGPIFL
jgi:phage terminase large subunit-like protein